jgi:hypothetical protein
MGEPATDGLNSEPAHPPQGGRRRIIATFNPTRVQDLNPAAAAHIGWRGEWSALWTLDDPANAYHAQTVWWPTSEHERFGLVPDEDLRDAEEIDEREPPS